MPVTWDLVSTYFTPTDVDHMKQVTGGSLDLSSCSSVAANAQSIYNMVRTQQMPPGQPWPAEWIDNFKQWMVAGALCPSSADEEASR